MSTDQYQQCPQLPGIFGMLKRTLIPPQTRTSSPAPLLTQFFCRTWYSSWRHSVWSQTCVFWVTTILSSHSFLFHHGWLGHSSQSEDYFALWVSPPWPLVSHQAIPSIVLLALICLTWAILFSIVLHHEWSYSSLLQSASVLSKSMSTFLIVRGRDCRCRLAVTLYLHCDSLVFNVSCLKSCTTTSY